MSETAVEYISVIDVAGLLNEGEDVTLIDARTVEEYAEAHASAAINIPIADLDDFKVTGRPITMCGSTGRGEKAAAILADHGVKDVLVMEGGLKAWREAGFPVD